MPLLCRSEQGLIDSDHLALGVVNGAKVETKTGLADNPAEIASRMATPLRGEMTETARPVFSHPGLPLDSAIARLSTADSAFTEVAQGDQLTPEQTYFGVVMYYFLQGRSPLMDGNGIPARC